MGFNSMYRVASPTAISTKSFIISITFVHLMALTEKQKRFCDEYLIDLNATQAAIRAGYSEKTAGRIAGQNLKKLEIQSRIQDLKGKRSERTEITQDRVLHELAQIGFAKVTDFVAIEGPFVKIKQTAEMPEEKIGAIAGIKEGANGIDVKLNDKCKALELIGRHLGMFTDKVDITGAIPIIFTGENDIEE
ncbi:MAG: terminase small subunit [Anaerovoracaceae bacterium]